MRVLIADRRPEERGSPERVLRSMRCATVVVPRALELVDSSRRGEFDAFVLRLETPLTEDLLAYAQLRADPRLRRVPVIFCISPNVEPADAASAFAAGADHVLVEPLETEQLVGALALPRARESADPRAALGALVHELNNVMTAVLGHADMLRIELPPGGSAGARREIEALEECCARARDVTERIRRRCESAPLPI